EDNSDDKDDNFVNLMDMEYTFEEVCDAIDNCDFIEAAPAPVSKEADATMDRRSHVNAVVDSRENLTPVFAWICMMLSVADLSGVSSKETTIGLQERKLQTNNESLRKPKEKTGCLAIGFAVGKFDIDTQSNDTEQV
ncbi:hypothetical protein Tco_1425828, partial [Tanacetum coccineum]